MMLPLAAISAFWYVVMILWILIALTLIVVVLLQKGRGGGLASAFGGAGASSLLGTKTGDFLTWVTIALTAGWLTLTVVMGLFMRPSGGNELLAPPAPAGQTQPVPTEEPAAQEAAPQTPAAQPVPAAAAPETKPAEQPAAQPAAAPADAAKTEQPAQ